MLVYLSKLIIVQYWVFVSVSSVSDAQLPVVLNTWTFTSANQKAWDVLQDNSALDAIEKGCSLCEEMQCDGTVGYGGSPDENGETTLDALIMDGSDMNVGAVVSLRRIKDAISLARHVLEHTSHSILAGDLATNFAIQMGFKEESLSTNSSIDMWKTWKNGKCQPNYWINVHPNPAISCGPYSTTDTFSKHSKMNYIDENNHDTIGMVAIDKTGNIAAGTTTNGMKHKIPGRVGDSPIPGSGAYADSAIGGAAATGDGDVMLRFLPSFLAVEEMRRGSSPSKAARAAISRIIKFYPNFSGAVIAINKKGDYGAACNGMKEFPFSVANNIYNKTMVKRIKCTETIMFQF